MTQADDGPDTIALRWDEQEDCWEGAASAPDRAASTAVGPAGPAGVVAVEEGEVTVSLCFETGRVEQVWVPPALASAERALLSLVTVEAPIDLGEGPGPERRLVVGTARTDRRRALLRWARLESEQGTPALVDLPVARHHLALERARTALQLHRSTPAWMTVERVRSALEPLASVTTAGLGAGPEVAVELWAALRPAVEATRADLRSPDVPTELRDRVDALLAVLDEGWPPAGSDGDRGQDAATPEPHEAAPVPSRSPLDHPHSGDDAAPVPGPSGGAPLADDGTFPIGDHVARRVGLVAGTGRLAPRGATAWRRATVPLDPEAGVLSRWLVLRAAAARSPGLVGVGPVAGRGPDAGSAWLVTDPTVDHADGPLVQVWLDAHPLVPGGDASVPPSFAEAIDAARAACRSRELGASDPALADPDLVGRLWARSALAWLRLGALLRAGWAGARADPATVAEGVLGPDPDAADRARLADTLDTLTWAATSPCIPIEATVGRSAPAWTIAAHHEGGPAASDRARVEALPAIIDDDDDPSRDVAPELLDALVDAPGEVQVVAAAALSRRLRDHHLEQAIAVLLDPSLQAGEPLVRAIERIGGVTGALGVALGVLSPSPEARAAALSLLPSVSPRGAGGPDRGAVGPVVWSTHTVPEPGGVDLVVELSPGGSVALRASAAGAVTVETRSDDEAPLSAVWLGGAAATGWVLALPGTTFEVPVEGSDRLVVAGLVQLDVEALGRPEWEPALATTLDLSDDGGVAASLLAKADLPPSARTMVEAAAPETLAERRVTARGRTVVVDVLTGRGRAMGDDEPLPDPVAAAFGRLALAHTRQMVSGSPLWSLDALSAVDELAALAEDLAPPAPDDEVVAALGGLPDAAIEQGGVRLHDVLAPAVAGLGVRHREVLDRLMHRLAEAKELEELKRDRTTQLAGARRSNIGSIVVGPDVFVAGLVPGSPRIEDVVSGHVRTVSILLEQSVGLHQRAVARAWSTVEDVGDEARVRQLAYHLAGRAAAFPAGRLARGGIEDLIGGRAALDHRVLDLTAPRSDGPPRPPRLYVGYLDARTPLAAVPMTPIDGRSHQLTVSARIAVRPFPLVIALAPSRTQRSGALDSALTFGHQAPAAAGDVLEGLAELGGTAGPALVALATQIRDDPDVAVSPGTEVVRTVHAARDRAAAAVLDILARSTASDLAGDERARSDLEGLLDDLLQLDRILAL